MLARPEYRPRVTSLLEQRRDSLASPAWFQQSHPQSPLTHVAYFSMEFALSEVLPIYVGISAARALGDYTPRLLPRHPIASIPLEAHEILWQR